VVRPTNAIVSYLASILVKVHVLQEWHWRKPNSDLGLQQASLGYPVPDAGKLGGRWIHPLSYLGFSRPVLSCFYQRRVSVHT
jgi:predicted acyltransferase